MAYRLATSLPAWDAARAISLGYSAGNIVWYQKDKDSVGFAYKAKNPYAESGKPPNEDEANWQIDYSWAVPWKQGHSYKIGTRVLYHNGQAGYIYVASVRYFGGTGKPNEEVDLDNIRTWELEQVYDILDADGTGMYGVPRDCEFLFPIKKIAGFTGSPSKNSSFFPADPEERPIIYINPEQTPSILTYIKINELSGKEDFSDLNSIYQSHPYDTNVYEFYSPKPDTNGNLIHERKGTHKAEYIKKYDDYEDSKYRKNGKSQFAYCTHGRSSYGQYYNPYGFSIEMWPHAMHSDYELVPSASLHNVYKFDQPWTYYTRPQRPPYYLIHSTPYGSVTSGFGDAIYINGEYKPPEGLYPQATIPQSDDSAGKRDAFFYTTTPAFSRRIARMYFIKIDKQGTWKQHPVYGPDENNPESTELIILGYYYTLEFEQPTITLISEQIDSLDISYKDDNLLDFSRTAAGTNQINFNKYKKEMVATEIYNCGWKVD